MRKITSLLVLFCMFVATAWAGPTDLPEITTDLNNPIYYTIYNTRSQDPGGLMYYAGDNVGLKDGCEYKGGALEAKYKFYFTGTHEALYIHNAAANDKKLASVNSWTEAGIEWAVGISPKGTGLAFGPKGELSSNKCWNEQNQGRDGYTTWSANDDGSVFVCEKVEDLKLPEFNKFYTIECPLFEKVQGEKKALYLLGGDGNDSGELKWKTLDLTDKNFYWIPVKDNDRVILKSANILLVDDEVRTIKEDYTANTIAGASDVKIYVLGSNSFKIVAGNTTLHTEGHNGGNGESGDIVSWNGTVNSASAWTFVEQVDPDAAVEVAVKYNFTYKNELKYTQTINTLVGQEYPAFTVSLPFGVTGTKPTGTIAASEVVDGVVEKTIELSVNLPFVPAEDYTSINKWYYIQMHSSPGYGKYLQDAITYIEWADAAYNVEERNSYMWGFIGNPFDGFKLVNYGAGESKGVNSTGEGNPALGDINTATIWQIKPSAVNKDNEHFCFQYPDSNQYMNAQSGKVAFWGSADQGSTMWVTEVDMTGATDLLKYLEEIESLVTEWKDAPGYLIPAKKDEVTAEINKAKEVATTKTGCFEEIERLKNYIAGVKTSEFTIQPNPNKFYKIVSSCTKDHRAGQNIYVNNAGGMQFANPNEKATDFARIWQFVSAGEGKFYLKNVERGTFMNTAKGHGGGQETAVGTETEAKAISIANMGRANIVSLIPTGGAMMHAQDNGSQVVAWNSEGTSDASAWKIEEVDINTINRQVTVGDAGYSTLVLGYNAVIPTGVEVYTVSNIGNDYVTLSEVTGVLAAGEAVVLKNAGTYNFNYTAEEATEIETNLLEGTVFNTNIEGVANTDYYVLSKQEGEVGLYKAMLNKNAAGDKVEEGQQGTHFLNNAFKAYLPVTTQGANMLRFNFGGETTAIDAVEVENANAPIYDLSGRRVLSTVKGGIYIQNGKKFIVK